MIDLVQCREAIDKIDNDIVRLFEERMVIAKNVAEYKMHTGKKIYDKEREEDKLKSLCDLASNEFNKQGIIELFTQIMSISRKYQYSLISSKEDTLSFKKIDKIRGNEETRVVCFGEKGSYTEQAMEEFFDSKLSVSYAKTFREVMECVRKGECLYGVLPIENTSTGGIADIYDLLVEYNNYIVGEHVIKVEHALLGLPEATLSDIRKVYSHPQGLMQCSKYLDINKEMEPLSAISTADSAKKVLEERDVTIAAIASPRAAKYYGLKILASGINHEATNSTRFIIISSEKLFLSNGNKISICFEIPHRSGSLYNILSHIIFNNLNMTKIESRPIEGRKFEYRFFVDFEGNLEEAGVKNALFGIKEEAVNMKILGNYKLI